MEQYQPKYQWNQVEAESLITLREQFPTTARAIFKMLGAKEQSVVRQFKSSRDTDAMLRAQGALHFLEQFIIELNKVMEVTE